jgi:hypothetical protein
MHRHTGNFSLMGGNTFFQRKNFNEILYQKMEIFQIVLSLNGCKTFGTFAFFRFLQFHFHLFHGIFKRKKIIDMDENVSGRKFFPRTFSYTYAKRRQNISKQIVSNAFITIWRSFVLSIFNYGKERSNN